MTDRPVAFITGASRGIGRGVAVELAKSGFDIVGCATSHDPDDPESLLNQVKARVEELGAAFHPAAGDIAALDIHEKLLEGALKRFGRVDVLVNNAGVAPEKRMDILETTPESFDRVLAVNLRGTFFLTQRIARWMADFVKKEPEARPSIIFISSVSAYMSSPSRGEYCLSKAALSHAAAIFAHRMAEYGVNVYEVRPGLIQTDMTAPVKSMYDERIRQGLIPQNRWGRPEDVGRAVAALARGDFNYSTGLVVELGGGMHIPRL